MCRHACSEASLSKRIISAIIIIYICIASNVFAVFFFISFARARERMNLDAAIM